MRDIHDLVSQIYHLAVFYGHLPQIMDLNDTFVTFQCRKCGGGGKTFLTQEANYHPSVYKGLDLSCRG